jgi:hypothetical protein
MSSLLRLGIRILGPPPVRDAPRIERLRWIRRFYLRQLPVAVIIAVTVAIISPAPIAWAIPVAIAVPWLIGFTTLHFQIQRERAR